MFASSLFTDLFNDTPSGADACLRASVLNGKDGFRYITTYYFYFSLTRCQVADAKPCSDNRG